MYKTIVILSIIGYALAQAQPVHADTIARMPGGKAAPGTVTTAENRPHRHTCDTTNQPPALTYYLDGDTPTDIAYQDYLSDLAWHNEQFNCQYDPEPLTNL